MARVDADNVDVVRLAIRTTASNGNIVHPHVIYEHGEP
jgi:hypothetical protein